MVPSMTSRPPYQSAMTKEKDDTSITLGNIMLISRINLRFARLFASFACSKRFISCRSWTNDFMTLMPEKFSLAVSVRLEKASCCFCTVLCMIFIKKNTTTARSISGAKLAAVNRNPPVFHIITRAATGISRQSTAKMTPCPVATVTLFMSLVACAIRSPVL